MRKHQISNLMKYIISLFLFVLLIQTIHANEWTSNDQNMVWKSKVSDVPQVEVFIQGADVFSQVIDVNSEFFAIPLKKIDRGLLLQFKTDYIRLKDFNNDGLIDIAVLKSTGFANNNACYSVFEYLPKAKAHNPISSKTVCF